MASRVEKQRVLSGSLNLLPPSDKIPDGDSLILDNWRVDQQGQLRSRRGCVREAGPVGSGTFHTLGRVGDNRYAGIGSALYWGPSLGQQIADGFDGQPLGLAHYQGSTWVMNRGKRLRVTGTQTSNWGIAAPAAAPTATAVSPDTITLNPYNADNLLSYAGYFDQNRVFQDRPQSKTILADQGTVTITNGSATVVGDGTNWDSTMTGKGMVVTGTAPGGGNAYYGIIIDSVEDATHLTASIPINGPDGDYGIISPGTGLTYYIYDQTPALTCGVNPTANQNFGTVGTLVNSPVSLPWYLVTNMEPGHDSRYNQNANDGDVFLFPFYADNPSAIQSVVVTLYSDQDTLGGQAPTVQATIGPQSLNQSPQSWTQVRILRAVNFDMSDIPQIPGAGDTTYPEPTAFAARVTAMRAALSQPHFMEYLGVSEKTGFGPNWAAQMNGAYPDFSTGGFGVGWLNGSKGGHFNWANITGMEIVVNISSPCKFGLGACEMLANIPGALTGSISYFVSFAHADDQDSNPSPGVDIDVSGQAVQLDNIPVSSDPQVTQRWIYRIGGGLDQALLVGKILDNTTTSYTDNLDNASAQNMGLSMPVNRTVPPAARGVIGPYLGKLIAFNSDEHPARYWWNNSAQPWFFPGADEDTGNWEDAGNDDDALLAVVEHKTLLLFYKQRSIWRLNGDPVNADPVKTNAELGIVGPRAVASKGTTDFIVGPEGAYTFNGDFETKISGAIDPIFKGDWVMLATGEWLPPIERSAMASIVCELVNDRLRISYPEAGQTLPNVVLVYHTDSGRWARETYAPGPITAMHYEGSGYGLMAGVTGVDGGYLYYLEIGATDDAQPIHVAWQSRASDQGLPDNFKWYSDLEIDFQTGIGAETPSTLNVALIYDNGAVQQPLGTISSGTRVTVPFQILSPDGVYDNCGWKAKNATVRITGDVTSTCVIYGVYLHWRPEERVARSFDSGPVGTERVRQVDYLEFVTTAAGQTVSYILSSDLPGYQLQQRAFRAFTGPQGRGTSRFRLPSIVEGRNMRLTLLSDKSLQLHTARMRQREIGEYIDGTNGEYWESPEFSVAPGRDGELKDLLLDYDASGGGELVLYCDQPGGVLTEALRRPVPGGLRHAHVFAFEYPDGTLPFGALFKVRVIPPADGVIRLHGRATVRARILGVSFDGGKGERWQTQALDLVGGIGEFREVSLVAQTWGPMDFEMLTGLPGGSMRTAARYTFDTGTERQTINFRVPGNTKGWLQQFRVTGQSYCRLFDVRVYGRLLGGNPTPWAWIPVPMEATPNEWANIQMPVHATPEEFTWVDIPVDAIE